MMRARVVISVVEVANVETCQDIHQYVWSRVARETEPTSTFIQIIILFSKE